MIFWFGNLKFSFVRNTETNVVLFFTVLLLHLTCLPAAKDGVTMMKYALVHSDEFTSPRAAFTLGFFAFSSMLFAEFVNIVNSQTKKTVSDAIAGFIGFKCIIDIPNIYMKSYEEFKLAPLIGKVEFTRSRTDNPDRPKIENDWLYNTVFSIANVLYKAVFFYFTPFATIIYPMAKSLEGNIGWL